MRTLDDIVAGMATKPSEPFDLELLDFVAVVLAGEEDGDVEDFAAGLEGAEGVFHVVLAGRVGDVEGARGVGLEEGLDDLAGLGLAGVAALAGHGDLQIVVEPGGKVVGVALHDVFADRDEDIIPRGLGRKASAQEHGQEYCRYGEQSLHDRKDCKFRATLLYLYLYANHFAHSR